MVKSITFCMFFLTASAVIVTASSQETCKEDTTCASAGEDGSAGRALLQTRKSAEDIRTHTLEHKSSPPSQTSLINAPPSPTSLTQHMTESRTCLPAPLQEAYKAAMNAMASWFSSGETAESSPAKRDKTTRSLSQRGRKAMNKIGAMRSEAACKGKAASDACSMKFNKHDVPGKCTVYGMDMQMHCEVGQFEACAESSGPSTDSPCTVLGMKGSCKGVTGYPKFDEYQNPVGTVTIYSCKISDESTLDVSKLPGGGSGSGPDPEPEPTEAPKPEPTEAPKPEPEPTKPDPISQSAIGAKSKAVCEGIKSGKECSLAVNQQSLPGTCLGKGMDRTLHCDVGQFSACAGASAGDECTVDGLSGQCEVYTSVPKLDELNNPVGVKNLHACNMLAESKAPNSLKEGATKGATELHVVNNNPFNIGQEIVIDQGTAIEEYNEIVGFGSLLLKTPLMYDHGVGALITPTGAGAASPLSAAGFKQVTALCCPPEMEVFFMRLLDSMGLQGCSQPHIQGLMHWFTCVPDMGFPYIIDVINNHPCKYWAKKGEMCEAHMASLSAECVGNWCR